MKKKLFFVSLLFLNSSLCAMEPEEEKRSSPTLSLLQGAPSISPQELDWEIDWKTLQEYMRSGFKKAQTIEKITPNEFEQKKADEILNNFRTQFEAFFKKNSIPEKTVKSFKQLNENLLPEFFYFFNLIVAANQGHILSLSSVSSSVEPLARNVVLSSTVAATEEERRPSLQEFQKIRSAIFETLKCFALIKPDTSPGLIKLKDDRHHIGYYSDLKEGDILFPVKQSKRFQIVSAQFDVKHQKTFVIAPNLAFVRDSGFVIEMLPEKIMKVKGFYGEKSPFTFTTHRTTARSSGDKDSSPFYPILKEIWPEVEELTENEVVFVPMPTTPQEWNILELLFIEDLAEEAKGEEIKETKQEGEAMATKRGPFLLEYVEELKTAVLSEYEQQIRAEQDEISHRVASGGNEAPKKAKKGKAKNKKKAPQKKQEVKKVDYATRKAELFKQLKAEHRKKFKDVLGILKSVAKKDPSLIQTVTTRGSHVSFHGTTGVETIAKPHGGRTDIASGIVNRMLAKLLGVDPRDSN